MDPTTTRTRLIDQEKMKICEEKKKPGFSIEKIMKDYSISRTGVYKILRLIYNFLQSSGIASGDDMFCLTRLENKVLKEQLAAKDAKKKQKSISHFFQKS